MYSCGIINGTTVDCYPSAPFDLYPDTKQGYANYSGTQINVIPASASEIGTIQWTLTYPQ